MVDPALPTDSRPYLEDGSLRVANLWDPSNLGYLTIYLANELVKGKKPVDGLDVPNIGKITILADGKTVIMAPPTDFTKENAKNYVFQADFPVM